MHPVHFQKLNRMSVNIQCFYNIQLRTVLFLALLCLLLLGFRDCEDFIILILLREALLFFDIDDLYFAQFLLADGNQREIESLPGQKLTGRGHKAQLDDGSQICIVGVEYLQGFIDPHCAKRLVVFAQRGINN